MLQETINAVKRISPVAPLGGSCLARNTLATHLFVVARRFEVSHVVVSVFLEAVLVPLGKRLWSRGVHTLKQWRMQRS